MFVVVSVLTELIYSGMYFSVVNWLDYIYGVFFLPRDSFPALSLSLNNGVMNMQITRGQLLGGEAFYFDFKWTSYAIMKMQMTLSSELKCRWDTVFPAEDLKSTLPGGLNSLFVLFPNLWYFYINLQVCSRLINIWKNSGFFFFLLDTREAFQKRKWSVEVKNQ